MNTATTNPLLPSQRIVQICFILFAAIGIFGGTLQMYLGEPETTPRLDNIHRFMAGIYFSCGIIAFWAALTIRKQNMLIFLLAMGAFLGGVGRMVSMSIVGLPEPHALWIGYLLSEVAIPIIAITAQLATNKKLAKG